MGGTKGVEISTKAIKDMSGVGSRVNNEGVVIYGHTLYYGNGNFAGCQSM